jgi:CRP-like cAMP-binding protein
VHRRRRTIEAFQGVALFEGCPRRKLALLARNVDRLRIPAGRVLSRAGQRADEVVVVVSGDVARTGVADDVLGPGSVIGAAPVVSHEAFADTVSARTDVEVLVVNGPAFRWAVQEMPAVARRAVVERASLT